MSPVSVEQLNARLDAEAEQLSVSWRETEAGMAEAFVEANGARLRYCDQWGRWLEFDGGRWREDRTIAVFDAVREHLRHEAQRNVKRTDAQLRALGDASTVAAVERLAKAYRAVAAVPDQFDADPWLLNTPDGIIDLRTRAMRETLPNDYQTKITACSPGGRCPGWLTFLDEVTNSDRELITFLQRLTGYCLTGSTREHALFFAWGTGANGKSTFINVVRGILGDYATAAPAEVFMATHNDRHPTEIATLRGARLVVAQEIDEGRRWNEARIKSLTGGDPVVARFMRRDPFEFTPVFKLFIAGNHKPALSAVDEAMRRRLHLIPFTVTVPPERRDPDLPDRLREEWPAILAWALAGAAAYLCDGLAPPECVKAATTAYFMDQNVMAAWLEEHCETRDNAWEKPTLLFNSWRAFADAGGHPVGNAKTFAERLEAHGFTRGRDGSRGRHWRGLMLRADARP